MHKYRIKKITNSWGTSWYEVEHQRKMFFAFGPLIWVNAGSFTSGYDDTTYFWTYEDAENFMKSLFTQHTETIVKEVVA